MRILFDDRQDKVLINEEILKIVEKGIVTVIQMEQLSDNFEISISFVDNKEIREINREFRNIDSETDVLSFPMDFEFDLDCDKPLGDVIISLEKALEQSNEFGHSFEREVLYLTVHSMYHLLGYDHIEEKDREIMREKEKNTMKKLGVFKDESKINNGRL